MTVCVKNDDDKDSEITREDIVGKKNMIPVKMLLNENSENFEIQIWKYICIILYVMCILKAGLFSERKTGLLSSSTHIRRWRLFTWRPFSRAWQVWPIICKGAKTTVPCTNILLFALKPMKEKHFWLPWQYDWGLNISLNKCQLCFWGHHHSGKWTYLKQLNIPVYMLENYF